MSLRPMFVCATVPALVALAVVSRPAAAGWPIFPGLNVPLCQAGGGQRYPNAVTDGKGGAIVAWDDQRGGPRDIYAQRVTATGSVRWAWDGVAICSATNEQYEPKLLADGVGGAIMVWADYRNGADYDIYAQRVDSSGASKWAANGVAICVATGFQSHPAIVSDGSGGAIIAWDDARSGNTRIFAQRVNASGAPQWVANGVVLTTQTGGQDRPLAVPSGAGGALVIWEDNRNGRPDLYGQRIQSTGALDPAWPAAGRAIDLIGNYQIDYTMGVDGGGGAYVAWAQLTSGTRDVFLHHVFVSSALDPAWPSGGIKLVTDFYDQSSPALLPDGAGGVLVSWDDARGSSRDIYAQHVLVTGAFDPAWPATGVPLCQAAGEQEDPLMVTDGAGGVIVTWHDITDIEADLYAQHLKSTGVVDPLWPTDGRAISTAGLRQVTPTIVADGVGGAVLAWEDGRNGTGDFGDFDIFSQGLKANGQLGDEPVGVSGAGSIALALKSPSPNPARTGAMVVRFSLPTSASATLDLFDVAGRRVVSREVGALGEGAHVVDLAADRHPAPGVYFLRLSQQGQGERRQRVVVLD